MMMERFFSLCGDPPADCEHERSPLHIVIRKDDIQPGRENLCLPREALQVATICNHEVRSYPAHRHLIQTRETTYTNEAWVVLEGSVEVTYFDVDDTELARVVLHAGDCSVSLGGGHGYRLLSNKTVVLEFKNGPYTTREDDKVLI